MKKASSTRSAAKIVSWPLNALAGLVDLFFCIPIIGRIIKIGWNFVTTAIHFIAGIVEFILIKLGYYAYKKLRVGVMVLHDSDGNPNATKEQIETHINTARKIYDQAKIKIVPVSPEPQFNWSIIPDSPINLPLQRVNCNIKALLEDLWLTGSRFQWLTIQNFSSTNFRRIIGYGSPLIVYVVEEIEGFGGCSLGFATDYVTVDKKGLITIAHELAHACNLLHRKKDPDNLMHPKQTGQTTLTDWQIALLRSSRHVTYL